MCLPKQADLEFVLCVGMLIDNCQADLRFEAIV